MQSDNDEFVNASNEYFKRLNGVNLLLLKEHTLLLQRKHYEEELAEVDCLIQQLTHNPENHARFSVEAEFNYLHRVIRNNKTQIAQLTSKLEHTDSKINELHSLTEIRRKYEKLIDNEYQNAIQAKLSMIRGKVDDLKKKIKQINKDILSYEQEHSQLIDEFSFEIKTLESYREKNRRLQQEIEQMRGERSRKL